MGMKMIHVDELLEKWATTQPTSVAFADEERVVTFADLNSDVRKIANVLAQIGISRGDIVAIALPPFLGWNFALALQLLGTTILPKSIETSFPKEFSPDWHIALTPDPNFSEIPLILFDNELLGKISASPGIGVAPGYANESDINYLISTSGTTGLKKYIAMSTKTLSEQVSQTWATDLYGKDEILTLPLFGGWWSTCQAYKTLIVGKPFINCGEIDQRLLDLLQKYSIRTFAGSPSQISSLMDLMERTNTHFPELETIILAGNIPSEVLVGRIRKQFVARVFDVYGSTEGGAITTRELTLSTPKGGKMFPEIDIEIIDEQEKLLPQGTLGQIRYRRALMATEYHCNPEATAEFFKEGFFYPGDLGYVDELGNLVIAGRVSEILNIGGVKMSPDGIDAVVLAQTGVLDCAAFAVMNSKGVEELAIAVVVDSDFDLARFTLAFGENFHFNLSQVIDLPTIPRNPNGKILRSQLSQDYSGL